MCLRNKLSEAMSAPINPDLIPYIYLTTMCNVVKHDWGLASLYSSMKSQTQHCVCSIQHEILLMAN